MPLSLVIVVSYYPHFNQQIRHFQSFPLPCFCFHACIRPSVDATGWQPAKGELVGTVVKFQTVFTIPMNLKEFFH